MRAHPPSENSPFHASAGCGTAREILHARAGDVPESQPWIRVRVPSRLHLGFVDLHGGLGRRFGSMGLAITGRDAVVEARAARTSSVNGDPSGRGLASLHAAEQYFRLTRGTQLRVVETPPRHAGLGSGTQLALACGAAVAEVHGQAFDARAIAPELGRGSRSGIGIAVFEQGGFIVDGGRGIQSAVAPLLARYFFPAQWRIVLVHDLAHEGLHGQAESEAFARLPAMAADDAAALARLCLMGLMPAVVEQNFDAFGAALDEIQQRIGAYFAPCQGGSIYISQPIAALMGHLRDRLGLRATGQSSWGPTAFVFTPDEASAHDVLRQIKAHPTSEGRLAAQIVTGCNHGAIIDTPG